MTIEKGKFYRLSNGTVGLVLHIWDKTPGGVEVITVSPGHVGSRVRDLAELERVIVCEVKPTWRDVEDTAPDPQANDLDFLTGMLDDG